jgi:DNA-binding transcriptional MerR regulator/quercetin dioxygenase-like cupin family protein
MFGYTIGKASQIVGVSPTTVRDWERAGLLDSARSVSGYRYFDDPGIARLRRIAYLRKVEKLNAPAIRRLLAKSNNGQAPTRLPGEVALGPRLRNLRRSRGLTLKQAAAASGLSVSFLSSAERGRTGVAPATLYKLVRSYGATLNSILRRAAPRIAQVKGPGNRRTLNSHGVAMELMADGDTLMDPSIVTLAPGASSEGSYSHEGEEVIYVLEGELEVILDGSEPHRLSAGESIYFLSTIEHKWRNPCVSASRVLWVNTPPSF